MVNRTRVFLVLLLLMATTAAFPKDVYLSIAGSVNNFRTDARIFNPSSTKDIQVQAYFLPVGNASNASVQPVTITIPKRQMKVLDDVVVSAFSATGLGAIRLVSDDDFVASQRIYAQTGGGTLGQFVPGLEPASEGYTSGVVLQLKSNATFRTNLGAVNPNATSATVTWYLYDKNNALVATGTPIVMPPYAVIAPTNLAGGFFFNASGFDLTDAWVSYTSDQPIFAYGSVIDNGTTDPTFVPASHDSGAVVNNTPAPNTYTLTAHQFQYDVTPALNINPGDQVTFIIHSSDVMHGFTLVDPNGETVIAPLNLQPGAAPITKTFVARTEGTYIYYCTASPECGAGHAQMSGTFDVGTVTTVPPYGGYGGR